MWWKPVKSTCLKKVKALVTQLCPTLGNPRDCSLPGSSVHGILLARVLEPVAIPSSRGLSWRKDQTRVSCTAGRFFTGPLGKPNIRSTSRQSLGPYLLSVQTELSWNLGKSKSRRNPRGKEPINIQVWRWGSERASRFGNSSTGAAGAVSSGRGWEQDGTWCRTSVQGQLLRSGVWALRYYLQGSKKERNVIRSARRKMDEDGGEALGMPSWGVFAVTWKCIGKS